MARLYDTVAKPILSYSVKESIEVGTGVYNPSLLLKNNLLV
jgi:hypothetical protein